LACIRFLPPLTTDQLRDAAKVKTPRRLPPAVVASDPTEPPVMRGKVRRAYRFFMADYESMQHYLEMAIEGCGGTNEFIVRAREALTVAQRAMHDCLLHHGCKRIASNADESHDESHTQTSGATTHSRENHNDRR
jgi:hypothetical protein